MPKSLVESQFGAHAAAYATSDVHAKGHSLERLVALTRPMPHWRVLDVATGAGHTALALAPHVARVIASDMTEEMLAEAAKLARARGLGNVETQRASAEALPFPDASFDLVTCRLAAHHFTDMPAFAAECLRVLVPGGVLALVDNIVPDALDLPERTATEIRQTADAYNGFERLRDPSHGRALAAVEWMELLVAAGFEIAHTERLRKSLDFAAYAERLACNAETTARLLSMLQEEGSMLRAFLDPHDVDGRLWFTLTELILVAHKPA
jgi:ubiquinone/menaquinone biosynthesis C-methylase UbiE